MQMYVCTGLTPVSKHKKNPQIGQSFITLNPL